MSVSAEQAVAMAFPQEIAGTVAIPDQEEVSRVMAVNRTYFDRAVAQALAAGRRGSAELAMAWAKVAAECAWSMHPGVYTHPEMELMLAWIGQCLDDRDAAPLPWFPQRKGEGKRWLHLLTSAELGGHAKLAERLIINAGRGSDDQHCVLLIDQGQNPIPHWLRDAVEGNGGILHALPAGMTFVDRVHAVRRVALRCDAVFLHTHPSDPVAPVTFARTGGPPVVCVNHADHVFWLGAGCCDLLAEIRPEGQSLTRARRGDFASVVLPIPLESATSKISREDARDVLGIATDQVALLSIGSSYKFSPYGSHSFQDAATELLRSHRNAVLLVVGPSGKETVWRQAVQSCDNRLRVVGVRSDLESYYAAADIYLESFPIGSLTATLDAMLSGIPTVRAPQAIPALFTMSHYDGLYPQASSVEEYFGQVGSYMEDPALRKEAGALQRKAVLRAHCDDGWRTVWKELISNLPERHKQLLGRHLRVGRAQEIDYFWADLQRRQSSVGQEKVFKRKVRTAVRSLSLRDNLWLCLESLTRDRRLAAALLKNVALWHGSRS